MWNLVKLMSQLIRMSAQQYTISLIYNSIVGFSMKPMARKSVVHIKLERV